MENNFEKNIEQTEQTIPAEEPAVVVAVKKPFPWWIIVTAVVAIALVVVLVVALIPKEEEPVYLDYSVAVVDGVGAPVSDVIVKFVNSDGESKTRVTDKTGYATLKNVLAGDYQVKIEQGYSEVIILQSEHSLTTEVNSLRVVVRDEAKTTAIYGDIPEGSFAYTISAGNYTIPCNEGQTSYFVFYAHTTGVYEISLSSNDGEMKIGHYGIPFYVQSTHRGEGQYDGKSFELIIQDIETPYVLGITASKTEDAILKIERAGDAPFDPQFAPWTVVEATQNLNKCTLPDGTTLSDLDVTDSTLSVSLGEDGYYYTSDGKLVYLRIGSVCNSGYLEVSIAYIAGLVDKNFGQNFGGYVYDDNGEFVGKYSYNDMLKVYYGYTDEDKVKHPGYCDASGVYPLTAELAEAIKCHGNSVGWWNPNAANYLFASVDEIEENAWLFLCCTAD